MSSLVLQLGENAKEVANGIITVPCGRGSMDVCEELLELRRREITDLDRGTVNVVRQIVGKAGRTSDGALTRWNETQFVELLQVVIVGLRPTRHVVQTLPLRQGEVPPG